MMSIRLRKSAPVKLAGKQHRLLAGVLGLLLVGPGVLGMAAPGEKASPAGIAHFEAKVRPVLVRHCYACHSAKAGKSEGGLRVDSRAALRAGGGRGPAVVPGSPEKSLLLAALNHAEHAPRMPPSGDRLPASVLADLTTWVRMGAPDPREGEPVAAAPRPPVTLEAGRRFWAFRKPVAAKLPVVKNAAWPKGDLDRFVLAGLEARGLAPSPDAEPATLLRRLHFDLVGLPPSPEAGRRFLQRIRTNGLDAALATEADALLASPQFGERWGRHWLDVARYAESSGKEANITFPYAWRYRDYVIDAVSADVPYDRFLREQIAGDLLPYRDDAERARLLIATGFLAVGPKNLEEGNPMQFAADVVDEQIDTVSRAVMASSVACARCHDHKFDPFPMQDYYALAGVFASTKTYFGTWVSPANRVGGDPLVLPRGAGLPVLHQSIPPERVAALKAQLAALKKENDEGRAAARKAAVSGGDPEKSFSLRDVLRIFWTSGSIEGQLEKVDEAGKALPLAMGVLDNRRIVDAPLLQRGEVGKPGNRVPRGFPRVVQLSTGPSVPANRSGRLELANWLTHSEHPLTSRVMVNRVWRHLFGAGLVRTVDNFGSTGERPSHPELLDHLALRFMDQGWSQKKLVRELVLSRAYRQSSDYRESAFRSDPENRLLWRAAKRRLDAEAIRDAMLAASGELDLSRPAGSLVARQIGDKPVSLIGLDPKLPADLDGTLHRSVYLPVLRDRLPDVLELFDFAEPSLVTGDRETTNVPVQALYLMNGPFVQARSHALADRLLRETNGEEERIRVAFQLCFGRSPEAGEAKLAAEFLTRGKASAGTDEKQQARLLSSYCQALLATAEFRNLD